jgi:hypothetical protein
MAATQPEQNHLADLIAAHEERVGLLRIQAARQGDDTPPHVTSEITRIEGDLVQLRQTANVALVEELGAVGRYQIVIGHIMRLDADIGRLRRIVEMQDAQSGARFDDLRNHIDARLDTILLALARPAEPPRPALVRQHAPARKGR